MRWPRSNQPLSINLPCLWDGAFATCSAKAARVVPSILGSRPARWTSGHRAWALGVEQFGQTGTIGDLYRHYGIDANAIIDAAESLTVGAPVRHKKMEV